MVVELAKTAQNVFLFGVCLFVFTTSFVTLNLCNLPFVFYRLFSVGILLVFDYLYIVNVLLLTRCGMNITK